MNDIMNDKVKHIIAGFIIAAFVGVPCYVNTYDLFAGLWGCTAGIIAGGVKEWCDNLYEWEWDWRDFAATCIGVAIAVLIVLGLHFGKG